MRSTPRLVNLGVHISASKFVSHTLFHGCKIWLKHHRSKDHKFKSNCYTDGLEKCQSDTSVGGKIWKPKFKG